MNLIGPKPESPRYPTPWTASPWGNIEDANNVTLYFPAYEVAMRESEELAKAIVEAINAYYGGDFDQVAYDYFRSSLASKDARIAELEKRAEAAINEMHGTERFAAAMRERAEAAEARVRDLEFQLEGATESLEEARGRVGELEAENERLAKRYRKLEAFYELRELLDDDLATFTAPDGRVFHVGQRVWCTAEREYGTVANHSGSVAWIDYPRDRAMSSLSNLRRVWDGSEEPDVPVGTVLRDAEGYYLKKKNGFGDWGLWTKAKGWTAVDEWGNHEHASFRPYVEWLPGDDE